jgi:hypothetical protein
MLPVVHLTAAYYRKLDDFLHHADMLSGFLPHPHELLKYVVVACFRKILFRVNHAISKPYYDFLDDIASSTDNFPPFVKITLDNSSEKSYRKHSKSDKKLFVEILPKLLPILQRPGLLPSKFRFPQLEQATSQLKLDEGSDPSKAYNENTYIEYHLLLVGLLRLFKASLLRLEGLKDAAWHSKPFDDIVWYVMAMGDALQAMAGGNIIKMHMKVIVAHVGPRRTMPVNEEILDDDCQRDHELYDIINTFPTSQAYNNWLKLMVVHFDAVRILITHMEDFERPKIIIKVITTPNPDPAQLTWKQLLNNEKYFEREPLGDGRPSIEMIIEFIEDLLDAQNLDVSGVNNIMNELKTLLKTLSEPSDSDFKLVWRRDIYPIIGLMNPMKNKLCSGSGFDLTVKGIINDMSSLKSVDGPDTPDTPADKRVTVAIEKIIAKLEELKDSALALSESMLDLRGLPSSPNSFDGSVHCELNLLCWKLLNLKMLDELDKDYGHIVSELSVSCIVPHSDSILLIRFTI